MPLPHFSQKKSKTNPTAPVYKNNCYIILIGKDPEFSRPVSYLNSIYREDDKDIISLKVSDFPDDINSNGVPIYKWFDDIDKIYMKWNNAQGYIFQQEILSVELLSKKSDESGFNNNLAFQLEFRIKDSEVKPLDWKFDFKSFIRNSKIDKVLKKKPETE